MDYREIEIAIDQGVLTLTLNRPARLNAWTDRMELEMRHATLEAEHDSNVRAIVVTGAGRGFCAGADMDHLSAISDESASAETNGTAETDGSNLDGRYTWFTSLSKPVIAAVNGPCVGLGLVMACYADIRFAARSAIFSTTFARRGLIAEHGISWILPRLVGHAHALDLLLSARRFSADEAEKMGLVNFLVDDAELMESALTYARDLAGNVSPRSTAIIKRQIYEACLLDLAQTVRTADAEMVLSFSSDDFREGVAHFVERRPAQFTGQ